MSRMLRNTCARAIKHYGADEQIKQAGEECLELALAIRHAERGKVTTDAVVTEIADVAIMIEQLTQLFGRERVDAEIARKLERLAQRIEREGGR